MKKILICAAAVLLVTGTGCRKQEETDMKNESMMGGGMRGGMGGGKHRGF